MTEGTPITASFVLTQEEVKAARAMHSRLPQRTKVVAAVIALVALSPVVIGVLTGRLALDRESFSNANGILIALAVVLFYFLFRYQWRAGEQRAFLQDPTSNKRVELSFSPEGIASRVEGLPESTFPWSRFVRVRRTAQGFLFYRGPRAILWAPVHAFASPAEAEAVAALAKEQVGNYSES